METEDRFKIEELHRKDMKASLERDYETLVSLMDEAVVLILAQGAPQRGKDAVAGNIKAHLKQTEGWRVTEYVHEFEEVEIAGEWAYEWGTYRGTVVPLGAEPIRETGKIMRILRKQRDGSWKVYRALGVADRPSQEDSREVNA